MIQDKKYDVIVIGGGASGMMAAISAARTGSKVLLLEKNKRLGEKLRITGGGRCNIWNEEHDRRLLLSNYGASDKFLHSAFARFGLPETIDFFHNLGLKTKVEARNRAFPDSELALEVVNKLIAELKKLKVDILLNQAVKDFRLSNHKISSLVASSMTLSANTYIFATGGASRPETGSTGDGFGWLKQMGHSIKQPSPTITPLRTSDEWIHALSGNTLKNIQLSVYQNGKRSFRLDGDVLCTHFGISGPLILNNAHRVADLLQAGPVEGLMDLYPLMDTKLLDQHVLELLDGQGTKQLKNTIKSILPEGLASGFKKLVEHKIDMNMQTAELTKMQRQYIVSIMKAMPVNIEGLMGFDRAVVADGGVSLEEINTTNMKSKLVDNLYVTGDLLDIKRPSGGYSLQLCWTTGYLAGSAAADPNQFK